MGGSSGGGGGGGSTQIIYKTTPTLNPTIAPSTAYEGTSGQQAPTANKNSGGGAYADTGLLSPDYDITGNNQRRRTLGGV